MSDLSKGNSPFDPGHPVPPNLFVGREELIRRVMERHVKRVAAGRTSALFVQGEYGIGKTSMTNYLSVDQQVFAVLRSRNYRSVLAKVAALDPDAASFRQADVAADLTPAERRKLDDFLRRMTALPVRGPGEERGEYVFVLRLVRLYIRMQTLVGEQVTP